MRLASGIDSQDRNVQKCITAASVNTRSRTSRVPNLGEEISPDLFHALSVAIKRSDTRVHRWYSDQATTTWTACFVQKAVFHLQTEQEGVRNRSLRIGNRQRRRRGAAQASQRRAVLL